MTKVSIVTISFNQVAFLERALRSVLSQDYSDIEYIIVDPGSTDGSRELIEKYRPQLAHVVFDHDEGPADGLNNGFARATGELCGYLNADDAYLPGAVERAVAAFDRNPKAAAVYAHGYIVDENDAPIRRFRSTAFSPRRYVFGGVFVMQQATFFRKQDWIEVGGFNVENRINWDLELLMDLALAGKRLVLVHENWGVFRWYSGSISADLNGVENIDRSERLVALSEMERTRIYRKVLGRDLHRLERALRPIARGQKWMLDPVGLAWRLMEMSLRSPSRTLLRKELERYGPIMPNEVVD
jgi:glycosyltransferase involved in cell wall biosynthesis